MQVFSGIWIRFFKSLGRMSYSSADRVYTLYNGNRLRQITDGCPEEKLEIIPNGVNVEMFKAVRRSPDAEIPPVLGLIGRVVPIKDIKNFIRAMRVIRETLPDAQGWLIGPQDEDEDYFEECKLLVESLDLQNTVLFLGFQKPAEMFPKLGLNVLTSVSEGQPLTTLEGYAAGIPAVTTDVGSCSELVHGVTEDDQAIGSSGAFTGSFKAYGFAGLISAGPWVLSILGVMLIGIVAVSQKVGGQDIRQFTTSVTWVMGSSLVLTGLFQLLFTRFIADKLFSDREDDINPNLFGALVLTTTLCRFVQYLDSCNLCRWSETIQINPLCICDWLRSDFFIFHFIDSSRSEWFAIWIVGRSCCFAFSDVRSGNS